ncbi:MAG: P-loop domain-containing protein, partial [Bacteroidales bacterium]
DKVKQVYRDLNVSTILVMGGSGDYFDVADHVIGMNNYKPEDLTDQAKQINREVETNRTEEGGEQFGKINPRKPIANSIKPEKGKKGKKIKTHSRHSIQFGTYHIDLSSVEQLIDSSQTTAIGEAMVYAKKYMDGKRTIYEILNLIDQCIEEKGLTAIGNPKSGNYAWFRRFELACALNRLRSLKIQQ